MIEANEVALIGSSVAEVVASLAEIHGGVAERRSGRAGAVLITFADAALFAIRDLSGRVVVRPILPPLPPKAATHTKPRRKATWPASRLAIGMAAAA